MFVARVNVLLCKALCYLVNAKSRATMLSIYIYAHAVSVAYAKSTDLSLSGALCGTDGY